MFLRSMTLAAALPLLSLSACATNSADEPINVSDGKADGDGTFGYYELSENVAGGYTVSALNGAVMTCDGVVGHSCTVPVLDFEQSGLASNQRATLVEAAHNDRLFADDGVQALVRGRLAPGIADEADGRFIVTEAYVARGYGRASGTFVKVAPNHINCFAAPCPTLTEKALDSFESADIAEVDFAPTKLSTAEIDGLNDLLTKPDGLIVAGDKYTFEVGGREGHGRRATAAYERLTSPAQAACYVGGCSSQICSDIPNVISTCEWKPEYACYHEATCERQADGACGWTETPELKACLGN